MEKAKRNLDERTAELQKLQAEKVDLSKEIEALQAERSAAVRALAGGDEKQRKVIPGIEAQTAHLTLRMEGLDEHLIKDARAAVDEANEEFAEAKAEEGARQSAFIQRRDQEENARLLESLGERAARICQLHHQLCKEIADVQIDMVRFQDGGVHLFRQLEDFSMSIPSIIADSVQKKGLKPLLMPGPASRINLWPLVELEEISSFHLGGPVNTGDVALLRRNKWMRTLIAEYEASKK